MGIQNLCTFVGKLSDAPIIRLTPGGVKAANFSLAINEKVRTKADVTWINAVAFNELAELAEKYLKKGSSIMIQTRVTNRKWRDEDTGRRRFATEFIINDILFRNKKPTTPSAKSKFKPGDEKYINLPPLLDDDEILFQTTN